MSDSQQYEVTGSINAGPGRGDKRIHDIINASNPGDAIAIAEAKYGGPGSITNAYARPI